MQELVDGRITVTRLKKMPMLANPSHGSLSIVSITAASLGDVSDWGLLWSWGLDTRAAVKKFKVFPERTNPMKEMLFENNPDNS